MLLKELEVASLITPVEKRKSHPMIVQWALTERGSTSFPILMVLAAFGAKWDADTVFDDEKPRKLHEFLDDEAMELIRRNFR